VGVRFSVPVQTGPGGHPASCAMGTGSFPGVKSGRCVKLTPYPLPVSLVMKEYSYTSTPPMSCRACTEPQCLYKGDLYLYHFLFKFLTGLLWLSVFLYLFCLLVHNNIQWLNRRRSLGVSVEENGFSEHFRVGI